MARKREERQQQEPRRGRRPGQASFQTRRRNCRFCRDGVAEVDYKDFGQLHHYVSERGKIRSRRTTGTCRRHQRQVAVAVKRAREMALLKYVGD